MTKPRKTTSKAWIERGPLAPWMLGYAQWLAQHPEATLSVARVGKERWYRPPPKAAERSAKANKLARRVIPMNWLTLLERRPDFVDYFEKLRADAQFLARELARQHIAKNLEVRDVALDRASGLIVMPDGTKSYGAMDYKAVETFTRPILEMAFPKKVDSAPQAPRVTINIGGASAETRALLARVLETPDEEISDVEFEVIETKQLDAGEE